MRRSSRIASNTAARPRVAALIASVAAITTASQLAHAQSAAGLVRGGMAAGLALSPDRRFNGPMNQPRNYRAPQVPTAPAQVEEQGRFAVRSVRLNGGSSTLIAQPGTSVVGTLELLHQCTACQPGAINQVIVGFAGEQRAQACVWNGGQQSNGWQQTTFRLEPPSAPGVYPVRVRYAQAMGCNRGALGWWRTDRPNGPEAAATIGYVVVLGPNGQMPVTPGAVVAPPEPPPVAQAQAQGSLVQNGGFEAPALPQGGYQMLPAIPGWSIASGPGIEVQHRVAGSPAEGNQHVELDSNSPTAIYQDLRTVPGASYELSFAFSARAESSAASNRVEVWFGGQRVAVAQASGEGSSDTRWVNFTVPVRASAPVSRLEFRDVGAADGLGSYIDSVSLVPSRP